MTDNEIADKRISRRKFMGTAAAGAAVLGVVAGATSLVPSASAAVAKQAQPPSVTTTQTSTTTQTPVIASKELTCDVLVIGSLGWSGLCASLHAAEIGANVIGIDKLPADTLWIGGDIPMSGQQVHVGNYSLLEPPSVLLGEINRITAGNYCTDVVTAHIANAARAWTWLYDHGITNWTSDPNGLPFAIAPLKTGSGWLNIKPGGSSDMTKFGGYAAVRQLYSYVPAQKNLTTLYSTTGVKLLQNEFGQVSGVIAQDYEGRFVINAGAVIICTGTFNTNKEMLVKYVGPHADEISVYAWGTPTDFNGTAAPRSGDGSGMRMALELGADTRSMSYLSFGSVASYAPTISNDGPGLVNLLGLSLNTLDAGIIVDRTGARFVDENLGGAGFGSLMVRNYGSVTANFIIDNAIATQPAIAALLTEISSNGALVYTASDIPTLATAAGINPWLATEVTNYNAAVANKTNTQQQVPRTGTPTQLSTPPYSAIPFRLSTGPYSMGSLRINANGNAVNSDGVAIPGLFVAGAAMGGCISGSDQQWNEGYVGNIACGPIWGMISAENALAFAVGKASPEAPKAKARAAKVA